MWNGLNGWFEIFGLILMEHETPVFFTRYDALVSFAPFAVNSKQPREICLSHVDILNYQLLDWLGAIQYWLPRGTAFLIFVYYLLGMHQNSHSQDFECPQIDSKAIWVYSSVNQLFILLNIFAVHSPWWILICFSCHNSWVTNFFVCLISLRAIEKNIDF